MRPARGWITWDFIGHALLCRATHILSLQRPFPTRSWPVLPAWPLLSLESSFQTMTTSWPSPYSALCSTVSPLPRWSLRAHLTRLCLLKTCPSSKFRPKKPPCPLCFHWSPNQKWSLSPFFFSLKCLVHSVYMVDVRFCLGCSSSDPEGHRAITMMRELRGRLCFHMGQISALNPQRTKSQRSYSTFLRLQSS